MARKIIDIEQESGEQLVDAISDYVDSCIRTGHDDVEECTRFFMRENDIDESEYYVVLSAIKECFENY